MTLELGIEDTGAVPMVVLGNPHVRHKEDVPHEHAIPDFYGLGRGFTLSEFASAVEGEARLRAELLDLIDRCTEMRCTEDDETFGLLVMTTRAHPKGDPRTAVEYVDLIMSDRMDEEGRARVCALKTRLGHSLMVEVERVSIDRPHSRIDGSNSFKIIRYAKAVLA